MDSADDFEARREHLAELTDGQGKGRFGELQDKMVDHLMERCKTQTSPSSERSVLLRMGFSSMEAQGIVTNCVSYGFLGKGAGHAVLKLAELEKVPYRDAGLKLAAGEGWDKLKGVWA